MPDELCDTCGRPCAGGVRRYQDPKGRQRVGCDDDNACRDAYVRLSPAQRRAIEDLAGEGYYLRRTTSREEQP